MSQKEDGKIRVRVEGTRINPGFDGMDAKQRGEPVEACPYEPGVQRTAWVVGWYIADKDTAGEANREAGQHG